MPSLIHAETTLALVAVGEERLSSARAHVEQATAAVGRLGTSRSWLGANVSAAMGVVLAAEGELAEAEHELATAEHFFRDDVPTIHEAWLLVLIASVRARRGRLDHAEEALRPAREALVELPDAGVLPGLVAEVERELAVASDRASTGAVLEAPSEAELAVLRLLATDLSTREIGSSSSCPRTRSTPTSGPCTGSSASTRARRRSRARPRSACWTKRNSRADSPAVAGPAEPAAPGRELNWNHLGDLRERAGATMRRVPCSRHG